jgi:hypothetical protein
MQALALITQQNSSNFDTVVRADLDAERVHAQFDLVEHRINRLGVESVAFHRCQCLLDDSEHLSSEVKMYRLKE